jgi:hypothetical protein
MASSFAIALMANELANACSILSIALSVNECLSISEKCLGWNDNLECQVA